MRNAISAALLSVAVSTAALAAGSYSGQQMRDIKSLSAEEVGDLAAGRGMGLAKPAELNHYPGPAHVLELKDQLGLSADQVKAVKASFQRMSDAAKPLGAELIAREHALDQHFADATITPAALREQTGQIASLRGKLRAVHLAAHLEVRSVLSAEQVARYDVLRGYSETAPQPAGHQHQHGG